MDEKEKFRQHRRGGGDASDSRTNEEVVSRPEPISRPEAASRPEAVSRTDVSFAALLRARAMDAHSLGQELLVNLQLTEYHRVIARARNETLKARLRLATYELALERLAKAGAGALGAASSATKQNGN